MSAFERAVRVLAGAAPGLGPHERADLVAVALESGSSSGRRVDRWLELGALLTYLVEAVARRQTRGRTRRIWSQGLLLGLAYAAVAELAVPWTLGWSLVMGSALGVLLVLLVPAVALLGASVDARLAVAVLVFWGWRLVLSDAGAGLAAVAAWGSGADAGELLVRWSAMACGVVLAWWVVRRTTGRRAPI